VTALVVLSLVPPLVPVTLTENEQLLFAGKSNEFMLIVLLPGLAEKAAAQVPVNPLGVATTRPLGSASLNETFSRSVLAFGLVRVKVRDVVPFTGMVPAPKALAIVGG
jgi:hypothetical protein